MISLHPDTTQPCHLHWALACEEARQERLYTRSQALEQRVQTLLAPGAACDPLSPEHRAEAQDAAPEVDQRISLWLHSDHPEHLLQAAREIRSQCWRYWEPLARRIATRTHAGLESPETLAAVRKAD